MSSITEPTTVYTGTSGIPNEDLNNLAISIYPNPASDLIAVQIGGILKDDLQVSLYDAQGKLIESSSLYKGSTIWHLDTKTLYDGQYFLHFVNGNNKVEKPVVLVKE